MVGTYGVQLRINQESEALESVQHSGSQRRIVFPDASREAQQIEPAEENRVRAEVVLEPMDVYLERQLSRLVAHTAPLLQLAEVIDAGHAFEAGLLVQQRVDLRDSHPELVVQEGVQTRIDVT